MYRWAFITLNSAQWEETRMVISLMSIPILQIILLTWISRALGIEVAVTGTKVRGSILEHLSPASLTLSGLKRRN